jgi:hypothetical protein
MSNPPTTQPRFVTCRCQHCNNNVEFDAVNLSDGDTATIVCPHCQMDTIVFVPVSQQEPEKSPAAKKTSMLTTLPKIAREANWLQIFLTSRFERTIFTLIRLFALFWAALMALVLVLLTFNYISSFFGSKATTDTEGADTSNHGFIAKMVQSDFWQNLGIYLGAASVILTMLTFVSIVLLLLAIERNTRRKD